MSEPYLGELKLMSFNYPPRGWAVCDGQELAIAQNQALFSLLGTVYGGDGRTSFGLPDLRSRVPVHQGPELPLGTRTGQMTHTLNVAQLPAHTHRLSASSLAGDRSQPALLGAANNVYADPTQLTSLHADSVSTAGGNQAHENLQPSLVLQWCIAVVGVFPSRN